MLFMFPCSFLHFRLCYRFIIFFLFLFGEARREWYRVKSVEGSGRKARLRECMSGLEPNDAAGTAAAAAAPLASAVPLPPRISWTAFKDDDTDIFCGAPAAAAAPHGEHAMCKAYLAQEAELDDDDDDDAVGISSGASDSESDDEGGMFVVGDLFYRQGDRVAMFFFFEN